MSRTLGATLSACSTALCRDEGAGLLMPHMDAVDLAVVDGVGDPVQRVAVSHVIIKRLLGKLDNRIGDYAVKPLGSGD